MAFAKKLGSWRCYRRLPDRFYGRLERRLYSYQVQDILSFLLLSELQVQVLLLTILKSLEHQKLGD